MVPYAQIDKHAPFSAAFLQHGMVWAAKLVSVGALLGEHSDRSMGVMQCRALSAGLIAGISTTTLPLRYQRNISVLCMAVLQFCAMWG